MIKVTWTPGPWECEEREERWVIRADRFHDEIASLTDYSGDVDAEVAESVLEEQRANARLIAAAPNLLKALLEFVDRMEAEAKKAEDLVGLPEYDQAIAAIKEATGQ